MKALLITVLMLSATCSLAIDITLCTSSDRTCGGSCETFTGDAGACIVLGDKSAKVVCAARTCANYNSYSAADCAGDATAEQSLCNVCDGDSILQCTSTTLTMKMSCTNLTCSTGCVTQGTFTVNTCSATGGSNSVKPTGFGDCQGATVEFYSNTGCTGDAVSQQAWVANQCNGYNGQDATINCTGPATPAPVQPSTADTHTVVLTGNDWATVIATDPNGVKSTVRDSIADALNVSPSVVVVTRVAAGSLIVDYYLTSTTLSAAQINAAVSTMDTASVQTLYQAVTNSSDTIGVTSTSTAGASALIQMTLVHALLALVLSCLLL